MLRTVCDHPDVRGYLSLAGIDWNFNLEKAPWWGGLFERMIRSTKRCLRKVLGRTKFSYDEMHTAIVEIDDAIVNSLPLAYIHPDDLEQFSAPSSPKLVEHTVKMFGSPLKCFRSQFKIFIIFWFEVSEMIWQAQKSVGAMELKVSAPSVVVGIAP